MADQITLDRIAKSYRQSIERLQQPYRRVLTPKPAPEVAPAFKEPPLVPSYALPVEYGRQ
jgi:hypothetical protein